MGKTVKLNPEAKTEVIESNKIVDKYEKIIALLKQKADLLKYITENYVEKSMQDNLINIDNKIKLFNVENEIESKENMLSTYKQRIEDLKPKN